MSDTAPQSLSELAEQLDAALRGKTFGALFFWKFALVRPHDQAYQVLSVRADGDRLDVEFLHASGAGTPGILSIWSPAGLEVSDSAVSLRLASRLRLDDSEAWPDGEEYRIRTPRGEGPFPLGDSPALTLQF